MHCAKSYSDDHKSVAVEGLMFADASSVNRCRLLGRLSRRFEEEELFRFDVCFDDVAL